MSLFTKIRWALACGLACGVVLFQSGDVLTYSRLKSFWPATAIPVHMVLQVGSSWSGAARNALSVWNGSGSRFRFSSGITSAPQRLSCTVETIDNRNVVVWSSNSCGEAWNPSTLAITRNWFITRSGETIDSDVYFNSNQQWGLYRGTQQRGANDFERVAIHEFGHVLGLDHPDEHGQSVNAIMNSRVSNIDTIQADDIAGVVAIYGGTARPPTDGCTLEDFGIVSASGNTVVRRTGTLGRDCVSPNYSGELARYYSFRLDRTSNIRIDMGSSTIDSWLTLRRGANIRGAELAFDDNGGSGLNARIDRSLEAGIYTIEATSLRPGETGSFSLALTVVPTGLPPSEPGRTNPTTLDLTCHGYDEGATRAYNCIPEPSQQRYMQTFVPAVGSACDGGSIAEFPQVGSSSRSGVVTTAPDNPHRGRTRVRGRDPSSSRAMFRASGFAPRSREVAPVCPCGAGRRRGISWSTSCSERRGEMTERTGTTGWPTAWTSRWTLGRRTCSGGSRRSRPRRR